MNMSKKQYKKYVKTKVTKSPLFKNMIKAEQEQNSIKSFEKVLCDLNISVKGTQVLSTQKSSVEIPMAKKDFKIFKMPNK